MMPRPLVLTLFFLSPLLLSAQQITFSEPYRDDTQDLNFEILGKMKGKLLIFKNVRWHYAVNIYNDSMVMEQKADLDFLPGKTFNTDCIAYPDFFYLIYQYQQKGILHCMAVKIGADGRKTGEPVELDTTQVGAMGDNKIYSAIYSEDRKQIMVFKIQRKNDQAHFLTKLYNQDLELQHQGRISIPYDDRRHAFGDFFLDNQANFAFTFTERNSNRENPSRLTLVTKAARADSFRFSPIPLAQVYLDEIKAKVDNINKRYVLNSFYYKERSGNIEGIYSLVWDAAADSIYASVYKEFGEDLRAVAKSSGGLKNAFNDFFIRNVILKRDGSFIITAEEQTSQATGVNNWNRYDYLYGNPYFSPYNYYLYSPYSYYRPFNSFGNQGVRYYSDNILVLSVNKKGEPEWTNIIHKQQYADDNDNYLSFNTFITSGEVHFLFNDISKREKLLSDNIMTPDGNTKRNPTLRTYEKGYEFMPRYAKQVGARQVIIPCTYRGRICFAKVDF